MTDGGTQALRSRAISPVRSSVSRRVQSGLAFATTAGVFAARLVVAASDDRTCSVMKSRTVGGASDGRKTSEAAKTMLAMTDPLISSAFMRVNRRARPPGWNGERWQRGTIQVLKRVKTRVRARETALQRSRVRDAMLDETGPRSIALSR